MKREKLIRSKEYIVAQIQLGLLNVIGNYKDKKKLKDYQLAKELGVSKGYVSQLLNATYDHKISKVVELALSCNKMPLIYFVDLDTFIKDDANDKVYDLIPVQRPQEVTFEITFSLDADKSEITPTHYSNTKVVPINIQQGKLAPTA